MTASAYGAELKDWRGRRRLSQLDLGLEADVSARHVSFLETGRAKPSREMILRLAEAMEVPLADRNTMLRSAGFLSLFPSYENGSEAVEPLNAAVDWLLDRHAPYPGFAIDRHWTLKRANAPATSMLSVLGLTIEDGANLVEALLSEPVLRGAIVNLGDVLDMTLARLKTENSELGGDPVLGDFIRRLETDETRLSIRSDVDRHATAVIPATYRLSDQEVSLFTTIAQFGTVRDLNYADLRIELLFPADAASEALLKTVAG